MSENRTEYIFNWNLLFLNSKVKEFLITNKVSFNSNSNLNTLTNKLYKGELKKNTSKNPCYIGYQ